MDNGTGIPRGSPARPSVRCWAKTPPLSMRINPLKRPVLPPFDAGCPPATRTQAVRDGRPRCRAVLAFGGSGLFEGKTVAELEQNGLVKNYYLGSTS